MPRILAILFALSCVILGTAFAQTYPGGFIEQQASQTRVRYTPAQIAAFMPATRNAFNFPAPYNSRGVRLTQPSDCPSNADCVNYIGYSYWANMNAHQADPDILIYVGFDARRGGTGINLIRFNKASELITPLGPIFPVGSNYRNMDCTSGCYFSGTLSTKLYFVDPLIGASKVLTRYDVLAQTFETVWDIRDGTLAGCSVSSCPYTIYQPHSSKDDNFHSFTLRDINGNKLGCLVKKTSAPTQVFFYARVKDFDECMLDKSGRWTVNLEYTASAGDFEPTLNRFFDNTTGAEVNTVLGPSNTLGHSDTGYDYIVGADNYYPAPFDRNSTIYYVFPSDRGGAIHQNIDLNTNMMNHPTHLNALPGLPQRLRMVCGSDFGSVATRQDELVCVRMDASYRQLIVAPLLTNALGTGGTWQAGTYATQPKGNIDVTGRYFIWSANLGTSRMDIFLTKIPSDKFDDVQNIPAAPSRDIAVVIANLINQLQAPRGLTLTFFEGIWLVITLIKYRAKLVWAYRKAGQKAFEYYWRYKVRRWLKAAPIMIEETFTVDLHAQRSYAKARHHGDPTS